MEKIIKLTGGRSTPNVYLKNGMLYRPVQKNSKYIKKFLRFLEIKNCPYTYRYIKEIDNQDVFSFIKGYVPNDVENYTFEQINKFLHIVKTIHDLSLEFTKSNQVICHNDLSPCNTVFDSNNNPISIIDWDSISVGERWEDLTYITWIWANIGYINRNTKELLIKIKYILDVYDADFYTRNNFSEKLIWRMDKLMKEIDPNNYQYNRIKKWVDFSKEWVIENSDSINKYAKGN